MIYIITNLKNDKTYVGYTSKTIDERFSKHKYNSKTGDTYLYRAMRKYGVENFSISILDEFGTFDDEKTWINFLKPEYNMTNGGEGGDTSSSEKYVSSMNEYHRNRSANSYATYGMLNKTHTEETKRKQSIARQQYWKSISNKNKKMQSEKISGKRNGMFGKLPSNAKSILINGVTYSSLNAASKNLGISVYKLKKDYL